MFNYFASGESSAESSDSKSQSAEVSGSQHVLVCALHELGCLVLRLGTSASPLVSEPTTGMLVSTLIDLNCFSYQIKGKLMIWLGSEIWNHPKI